MKKNYSDEEKYGNEISEGIISNYDKELVKTIKEKVNQILENEGNVSSNELRGLLNIMKSKNLPIKEYRKNIPIFIIPVEEALKKGIPIGEVDGLDINNKEDFDNYIKNNKNKGLLSLQIDSKTGVIETYAIGKEVMEKDYVQVDTKTELKNVDKRLLKYLEEKNISVENLPILKKNASVFMIKFKDIKKLFPEVAQKLLKDGMYVDHWGVNGDKIDEDRYFVLEGEDFIYSIGSSSNGLPIGYELVGETGEEYKSQMGY